MSRVYFYGIRGVGMTALACSMQDAGWSVAGADTGESFITDSILNSRNIRVSPRLTQPIPPGTDLVIYSGAYSPPVSKIRTLPLAEALAEFVRNRRVIAVAGVRGKTTTAAMLTTLLRTTGHDVGYYIGTSDIPGLTAPGAAGTDPYFVVEADEYAVSKSDPRPKFSFLSPRILVTTNILHDHPDLYPNENATLAVYTELVRKLAPGSIWICSATDPFTQALLHLQDQDLQDLRVIQYGPAHPLFPRLKLQVFGHHNRLDALAAILAARKVGLSANDALHAIGSYRGAKRRQEKLGEVAGRLLYDDYAHHPHEITATIQAFRAESPRHRLVLIFESHTYSRTKALFPDFAKALSLADQVFVMPIFASAREKDVAHTVTSAGLAQAVAALGTTAQTVSWPNAATTITAASKRGDLLLTMGAGFVYKLHDEFRAILRP